MIFGEATRVMSLRDGTKKMSKSDTSEYSRINMSDEADDIAQKVRKAKTDPHPIPETSEELAERPEARNLIAIYAALSGLETDAVLKDYAGKGFGDFKKAFAALAVEVLGPIGSEMKRLTDDPASVDAVLKKGAEQAREIAEPVIEEAKKIVGFLKP
jgi:tryptophanyl-tRNA synthetase